MSTAYESFDFVPDQPSSSHSPVAEASSSSHNARTETPPDTRSVDLAAVRRNRNRVLAALLVLLAIAAGPLIVGRFIYHYTYNELKAGYDVATTALSGLKPRLNDLELASRLVAQRVEPSVVSIYRPVGRDGEGQGSGVIVDHEGYIITNYHVVEEASTVQVQLHDGRRTTAAVIGDDPETDLTILKIDLPNLMPAEWGDSSKLQVGDLVWALGSPFGLDSSITFGIVSAKGRHGGGLFKEYLQTDAAVNPGNSGGPLVNIDGQVIGINAAIVGQAYQGVSFAIPSAIAHARYDDIRRDGQVNRAWLGVELKPIPSFVRRRMSLEDGQGVYIESVEPNSPADRAGFQPFDVILKWNGAECTAPESLVQMIAGTAIGSQATAIIARRGDAQGEQQQVELNVTMERRPRILPTR